jgi:hypothetical protein
MGNDEILGLDNPMGVAISLFSYMSKRGRLSDVDETINTSSHFTPCSCVSGPVPHFLPNIPFERFWEENQMGDDHKSG